MNKLKKLASLVLALVMALALAAPAFAADNGSIIIENSIAGAEYKVYRIFELESHSGNNYSYKVAAGWNDFVTAQAEYVELVDGYVNWKNADKADDGAAVKAFAVEALAYAKQNNINPTKTGTVAAGEDSVTISGLPLGYYLVDSTVGTICALDTTGDSVTIEEKNEQPTSDKKIVEGEQAVESNSASIGDTVTYKITVNAKAGAENYVVHDKMDAGLTFGEVKSVTAGDATLTANDEYEVKTGNGTNDDCSLHIEFKQTYLNTITDDTTITIIYTATLNENATIVEQVTDTNNNTAWLGYGANHEFNTTQQTTQTSVYKFEIMKTDSKGVQLDGAKFRLYDAETGGNEIPVVKNSDGTYSVATEAQKDQATEIEAGKVVIKGLGTGTYWLEETQQPTGYNKLTGRVEVKIESGNKMVETEEKTENGVTITYYKDGGVQVINKTGAELPSTGGIGTTIFYVVGGVLAAGAVILLITKRRMNIEK